jgi:hypothetical protein
MIPHKKPNPAHHNAGRLQNFNQSLTTHLSFANFTLKGFTGNISSAANLIERDKIGKHFSMLPQGDRATLHGITRRLRNLAAEARELAEEIAEFNRDKTKLDLGAKASRKERAQSKS